MGCGSWQEVPCELQLMSKQTNYNPNRTVEIVVFCWSAMLNLFRKPSLLDTFFIKLFVSLALQAIFSLKLGHELTMFRLQPNIKEGERLQIHFWGQDLCLTSNMSPRTQPTKKSLGLENMFANKMFCLKQHGCRRGRKHVRQQFSLHTTPILHLLSFHSST